MCAASLSSISLPSVSRIRRCILPLLDEVLILDGVSLAEAVAQGDPILVDGIFIRKENRPASGNGKDLPSGKHNIQVAGTMDGDRIVTSTSDPADQDRVGFGALLALSRCSIQFGQRIGWQFKAGRLNRLADLTCVADADDRGDVVREQPREYNLARLGAKLVS